MKCSSRKKITIRLRPEARKWIVDKTCADRSYGARPLRRAIQKYIEDPLSEALIKNQFRTGYVFSRSTWTGIAFITCPPEKLLRAG